MDVPNCQTHCVYNFVKCGQATDLPDTVVPTISQVRLRLQDLDGIRWVATKLLTADGSLDKSFDLLAGKLVVVTYLDDVDVEPFSCFAISDCDIGFDICSPSPTGIHGFGTRHLASLASRQTD